MREASEGCEFHLFVGWILGVILVLVGSLGSVSVADNLWGKITLSFSRFPFSLAPPSSFSLIINNNNNNPNLPFQFNSYTPRTLSYHTYSFTQIPLGAPHGWTSVVTVSFIYKHIIRSNFMLMKMFNIWKVNESRGKGQKKG